MVGGVGEGAHLGEHQCEEGDDQGKDGPVVLAEDAGQQHDDGEGEDDAPPDAQAVFDQLQLQHQCYTTDDWYSNSNTFMITTAPAAASPPACSSSSGAQGPPPRPG